MVKSYEYRTTIVRLSYDYRTTIVRLSYDYRTTIVRLSYDYRTTIVRLSYDYRTTIVRLSYDYRTTIVRLSYDYRTTIVRLSYDYRTNYLRFHRYITDASQTHLVQCDHKIKIAISYPSRGLFLEIYDVTHSTTSHLGVTKALAYCITFSAPHHSQPFTTSVIQYMS